MRFSDVSAAILAGGKSSRFGEDKSMARVQGESITERNVRLLKELFDDVMIIANSGKHMDMGVPVYGDRIRGMGPLCGIHSALSHCKNERCFIMACDMPFASKGLVSYIVSKSYCSEATVPVVKGGIEPLFGVYSKMCIHPIEVLLGIGSRKTTDLLECVNAAYIDNIENVEPSLRSFFNINYRGDLQKAEAMA